MKTISFLITLSFLFSLGPMVLAQETELPDPGLTPDSPFYFLEIIAEEIGTFFTFGDLKKAERHAALAAERLVEAQVIAGKGKPELTEKTLARYENQLEKSMARVERAESKGENTEKVMEVLARVGQATSKHLEVLAEVYEKVPEEAKPAIENAMKVSVKGHEKAVESLKAQNALGEVPEQAPLPVKVPQEVRERVRMRAQQELEVEKAERAKENGLQSFESFRVFCIEQGTPPEVCTSLVNELRSAGSLRAFFCAEEKKAFPPEMCEKIPPQGFESFEQLVGFCMEAGGTSEICAPVEGRCREAGVTTPDECFLVLLTATVSTSAAPSLSEEEMQQREKNLKQRYIPGVSKVIIYTSPSCPRCVEAKSWFQQHGITYEEIDIFISENAVKRDELMHKVGHLVVPIVEVEDDIIVGFTEESYSEFFGME